MTTIGYDINECKKCKDEGCPGKDEFFHNGDYFEGCKCWCHVREVIPDV